MADNYHNTPENKTNPGDGRFGIQVSKMTTHNTRIISRFSHIKNDYTHSIQRRAFLRFATAGLCQLLLPFPAAASHPDRSFIDTILFTPPSHEPIEKPLLVFQDFVPDFDREVEMRLYQEIADGRDLMEKLKKRLHFKSRLSMKIDSLKVRLLFIPEPREDYADAYRAYCRRAVDYTCRKLNYPAIYERIVSLNKPRPEISTSTTTAYLVHRLVKAYTATCTFASENGESVSYTISGGFVSSQLGAVDLEIESPRPGTFSLKRKPYSIWQSDTDSRFNLLAVPIEESLHSILGPTTDRHIETALVRGKVQTVYGVHQIADHWIAIEEALVGGILHQLMKALSKNHTIPLSPDDFTSSLSQKKDLLQYRYRARGVALVKQLGIRKAVEQYKRHPDRMTTLLKS